MSLLYPDPNAVNFLRIFSDFLLNNKTLFSKSVLFYHGESVYRTFLDNVNALPVSYTHLDVYKRQRPSWTPQRTPIIFR